MKARRFLMLQGVCSPFFRRLAARLERDGHRVFKVNFNVGDHAYWGKHSSASFRSRLTALPEFLEAQFSKHDITDQIVFGDCRPVHEPAIRQARECDIRNHVFEEGYFRPHWITLEREGANAHSRLPRDAAWFRRTAAKLPDLAQAASFSSSFWKRAAHDVAYHSASFWNPLFFPHYRTHAPVRADREYLAYLGRFARMRRRLGHDTACVTSLVQKKTPYFLLPLQLDSDAQIRTHSGFGNMRAVIDHVCASFARTAPAGVRLLIKNHPLDNGVRNYARIVAEVAAAHGIAEQVDYIESGDLYTVLHHARGTITVNSTAGLSALGARCPTFALGNPIYKLSGLTADGDLDSFWNVQQKPDRELFRCFRKTVINLTQINGGFYSREGMALAAENSLRRLTEETSLLESLL